MISEELKRIKEAKDALKVSINNKGVTVTDADSISVYASKVDLIVTGSTIEMQSIDITENGKYENTSIPYSSVTVNVPQTGSDITLTEITITDVGEYTAPEKIAYNKVLVPSETFYKKYTDGEGNTYIINENGEIIVTYTGSTPPTPTDEYVYLTVYIPTDKIYSSITSTSLKKSAFTEVYFDGEPYTSDASSFNLNNLSVNVNTYHTIKARLVNDNDMDSINTLSFLILNFQQSTTGIAEIHTVQFAYGTTAIESKSVVTPELVKNIIIPNSVTSIGSEAFQNWASLANIEIPNSVTSIGSETFRDCTSLTSITIPNSVTTIGESAFYKCTSLTNITIGSGVTSIGSQTFRDCTSLTSITIGSGITSIGIFAFYGCTSLTSINYNGTKSQFTSITKSTAWKYQVPTSCIVHCTDGDYPITDFN